MGVRGATCGSPGGSGRGGTRAHRRHRAIRLATALPNSAMARRRFRLGSAGIVVWRVRSGTGEVRANKVPVNSQAQPFAQASRVGHPYTGRMRTVLWLVVAGAVVMATVLAVQTRFGSLSAQPTSTSGPALDEIRSDDIAAHLRFLSDDLLEGRAPSTRGGQLAAKYLASQLALLGFEPAGDNGSYFQDVAIVEWW